MIKNKTKYLHAKELWEAGDVILAGKSLFESIDEREKMLWIISLLKSLSKMFNYNEIFTLIDICNKKEQWYRGREVFDQIRILNLETTDKVEENVLYLLENIAKTVFNMSENLPKYDIHSSWKISKNIKDITDYIKDDKDFVNELLNKFWCR